MRLFGKKQTAPIQVSLDVRAFIEGRMVRVSVDVQACEGDRLKGLLKRLRREGALERSLVRLILQGHPGVTLLRNGSRLHMPQAASVRLADGDTLAVLTPVAGG
jgi:molybdopterin converting factor small subunit